MAIVRNLATVKTTADITSSATSVPVNRVDVFGTSKNPLDNPFYVTIMPASGDEPANLANSEIVLVTGISGSNLTVTRAQRDTTAKAFSSGAIVTMAIYAEDAVLLGDEGTAVETPAPWIETSDIKNGQITTDKIADGSVTNKKVDFSSFIKTGTVQVEYQANNTSGGFVNVTFNTPFTNTPIVFAQDLLANGSVSSVTVSKVTTTGFRVLARTTNNSSSGTATVNWLAFSQQG